MRAWAVRWASLLLVCAFVAAAAGRLVDGRSDFAGAQESTATPTPTGTPTVGVAPEDIGGHIAAIEGPRHGLGSAAEKAELNEVATYIDDQLSGFGLDVQDDPVTYAGETFPNVIGTLPGAVCPDTSFIVGAHYDTVNFSPGADDNASGIAAVLGIAEALSVQSFQPSLEFVGFSFEEDGLIGSRQMADQAAAAGRDIAGVLALDMIGYTCDEPGCQAYPSGHPVPPDAPDVGNFISVIGDSTSEVLLQTFLGASSSAVPGLPLLGVSGLGECQEPEPPAYCVWLGLYSDQRPFWDRGFQALLVTDTAGYRNPYYHQPSDTLGTLNLDFAADVANAGLAAVVAAVTADHDADGVVDKCDPDDDNDGCTDSDEMALGLDPFASYDVYDVPVPAMADPTPNGVRDRVVDLGDVLAVLFYAFADEGGPPNAHDVSYDSDKGADVDGDTVADTPPDGVPDGREYDRSPGLGPDPVTGIDPAGEPNGVIDIADVLAALAQAFAVDCSDGP